MYKQSLSIFNKKSTVLLLAQKPYFLAPLVYQSAVNYYGFIIIFQTLVNYICHKNPIQLDLDFDHLHVDKFCSKQLKRDRL